MGFGLRRSNSQSEKRGGRRQSTRPITYYGGPVDAREQAFANYGKAKARYDAEESLIMKDERDRVTRNQAECKYRMDRADRKLREERERLDNYIAYQTDLAKQQYRAGQIDARGLDKIQQKLKKRTDMEWASFSQWHQDQLASAQKVLFERGDQIGAEIGAALRQSKATLKVAEQVAKRHGMW